MSLGNIYAWGVIIGMVMSILTIDEINAVEHYTEDRGTTLFHSAFLAVLWPLVLSIGIGHLISWMLKSRKSSE